MATHGLTVSCVSAMNGQQHVTPNQGCVLTVRRGRREINVRSVLQVWLNQTARNACRDTLDLMTPTGMDVKV